MESNRDSGNDSGDTARTAVTRRRALLGMGGVAASALAGCLGSGASGASSGDTLPPPVQDDPNVTVAAYEDYACPHCRAYVLNVLPKVEAEYIEPDKIRYEHHDFPIPVARPESFTAANAARAVQARTDGAEFWTYSRSLYQNQLRLGPDLYETLANEMGLDGQTIRKAAVNRKYETTIMSDKERGLNKGVSSTPTVFVNGNALLSHSFEAISSAIESAL